LHRRRSGKPDQGGGLSDPRRALGAGELPNGQRADTLGEFDIVYNDVLKPQYPETWLQAKDRVRPGGLYIADNVLWSGRVTPEGGKDDNRKDHTEAIKRHNELIYADPNFDSFIHPVRDGLLVARKKDDSLA
jgi:caffeoyl-CoA O-methyltransferase